MWNSPRRPTKDGLQFSLQDMSLAIDELDEEMFLNPDGDTPPAFMAEALPEYFDLPPRFLIARALNTVEQAVSKEPSPKRGHPALDEMLMFNLHMCAFETAKDMPAKAKDVTKGVNRLCAVGGLPKVRWSKMSREDMQDILGDTLFWDDDWNLFPPVANATYAPNPTLAAARISESYYTVFPAQVSDGDWEKVKANVELLTQAVRRGEKELPSDYMPVRVGEPTKKALELWDKMDAAKAELKPLSKRESSERARAASNQVQGPEM